MKLKFNVFAFIALVGSAYFINYKLMSVGVPDAYIIMFSIAYGFVFPWKTITVLSSEEGGPDETSK